MELYYEPMEWESTVTVNEALYQPFSSMDSLRLLTLEPGYLTDPILVRLSIHDADDAPEYDAISYVWGDVGKTTQIFCNGSPTHITFNLLWVLRRIRQSEQPMTLWVDALCINQNDQLERSGQVAKMGRIYAGARRVFACMGDDPDGGASGVTSLLGQLLAMTQSIGSTSQVNLNLNEVDPRWFSLGVLLRQPWFSRAWVLQEVGLAKDPRVIYGNFEFSYRNLMKIVMWVNNNASWLIAKANIALLMIHIHWADWSTRIIGDSASPYEFLDLLDHASLLKCRDPRDHIYAFLGHPLARTSDGRGLMILPDYTKSTWEVFKEVSTLLIQQSGLRALSTVEHSESSIKDKFPSWVIRWDIGYVMNNICRHPQTYRASAKNTTNMQYQILGDELWVTGVVVDTVRSAWKIEYGTDGTLKFRGHGYNLTLEEIISYLESTSTPCAYGSNRLHNFSLTLNASLDNSLKSGDLAAAFNAYRNWHARPYLRPIYKDELAHAYWRAICHMCSGRVFIVTEKGYYGLAPWVSAPGDVSCFLFGGLVPFLFRREDIQASRFKLIGEAYISGLMNSEASHFLNAGQLMAQNLIIC